MAELWFEFRGAIQDLVGGWEADVSVLVSIPEGKRWEMQVVIKESLIEGLSTEVWQGYKSQQGDKGGAGKDSHLQA